MAIKGGLSEERSEIIDNIKKQLEVYEIDYSEHRCMNWEEIKLMKEEGMYFGSHGSSHTSFSSLPKEALDQEIKKSLENIESSLLKIPFVDKDPVILLAYKVDKIEFSDISETEPLP